MLHDAGHTNSGDSHSEHTTSGDSNSEYSSSIDSAHTQLRRLCPLPRSGQERVVCKDENIGDAQPIPELCGDASQDEQTTGDTFMDALLCGETGESRASLLRTYKYADRYWMDPSLMETGTPKRRYAETGFERRHERSLNLDDNNDLVNVLQLDRKKARIASDQDETQRESGRRVFDFAEVDDDMDQVQDHEVLTEFRQVAVCTHQARGGKGHRFRGPRIPAAW